MLINLLVDGNYVFHQEYAVFSGWSRSGGFPSEREEIEFLRSVAVKFFYAVNQLPINGKVVFTFDSRSWRKAVDIPNGGYKSSRTNEDGDKGGMDEQTAMRFFSLMEEFGKLLGRVGVVVSRIGGCEGDDLIYRWSDRLYRDGQSCIIVSGDRDLTQLVRYEGDNWIIQWNNKKNGKRIRNTMFVPGDWAHGWLGTESEMSIFNFSMSDDRQAIKKLINDQGIELETVYPDLVIMDKILSGDDGDDVPPVWTAIVKNKKGEQTSVRMTGKKPGRVIDVLCELFDLQKKHIMSMWMDDDFMDECAGLVLRTTKDLDSDDKRELVKESMQLNAKLVWLDERQMPYNLIAEMDMHIDDQIINNHTQRHRWNLNGLFEGTRFQEGVPPRSVDPFIGMDLSFD